MNGSRENRQKSGETMHALPIAVFDSGVGGISVLRELVRLMPQENFLYYGDSANAPYGTRTTQQVRALTMAAAEMLMQRGIKALVVACNTATAAAIVQLRQRWPEAIIIGIEPALKLAADRFPQGNIGVMATPVTLREEKFSQQAQRFPQAHLQKIPAPGLVELIEQGKTRSPELRALLQSLLSPHVGKLDALVLGCTHYPFAAQTISEILGPDTVLLDGGPGTARQTWRCLQEAGLLHSGPGSVHFESSSQDPAMISLCKQLLQEETYG